MKEERKDPSTVLNQYYLSAYDLTIIIPNLKIGKARVYIKEAQKEMENKGIFIPQARPKVALTKIIKKKFGL